MRALGRRTMPEPDQLACHQAGNSWRLAVDDRCADAFRRDLSQRVELGVVVIRLNAEGLDIERDRVEVGGNEGMRVPESFETANAVDERPGQVELLGDLKQLAQRDV
ncbi:hypothetical protein D3C78_1571360 [compost metagenome]